MAYTQQLMPSGYAPGYTNGYNPVATVGNVARTHHGATNYQQYTQSQQYTQAQQYNTTTRAAHSVDPWSSPRITGRTHTQRINLAPGESIPDVGYVTSGVDPVTRETYHERVVQEGTHKVLEKVIELAKRVVQERVVDVPEVEYVTKIIDVPEVVVQERIVEKIVERVEQRIVPVPRQRIVEVVVEVPQIEYVDVPVERVVEVPEYREEVVTRQVEVPQYVEVPYPEYREVPVPQEVERHLPVPVEVTATFEYRMPCIRPVYKEVPVPIYVPRYIEVPVPAHMMDPNTLRSLDDRVNQLARNPHTSLDDLKGLADQARGLIPNGI